MECWTSCGTTLKRHMRLALLVHLFGIKTEDEVFSKLQGNATIGKDWSCRHSDNYISHSKIQNARNGQGTDNFSSFKVHLQNIV